MRRSRRSTSSPVTLLCLAGLVVAGVGIAYCVHLGAEREERDSSPATSAAAMQYLAKMSASPAGSVTPTASTTSTMLLGTVEDLDSRHMTLQVSGGARHVIELTESTHYDSGRDSSTNPVQVGDTVVVHVQVSRGVMTADLVLDGRITATQR